MLPIFGIDPDLLPEYAFATKNFHSGYYLDSSELESLLGFQRKVLQDYFTDVQNSVSAFRRLFVRMIPKSVVRKWLLDLSEPLKAVKDNDIDLIKRFYGSKDTFDRLIYGEIYPVNT
jgi:hypothetical protein